MSKQEEYTIEQQFYIVDSKIAVTKSGNNVTEISERPSVRTYQGAKRLVGKLWINDIDYYEAVWEYNPTLKVFEIESMVTEFSKMSSKDDETSLGYKYNDDIYDFLDDMYELYNPESTQKENVGNVKEKVLKCECGSDKVNSPFHSDWCPKVKQ